LNYTLETTNNNTNDRTPVSLDAESKVIGCCLLDSTGETFQKVKEIITPDDFSLFANNQVFYALDKVYEKHNIVDELLIIEFLSSCGSIEEIGVIGGLLSYTNNVGTTMQAIFYAKIVKEKSVLRSTIRKCRQSIELAMDNQDSTEIIQELNNFVASHEPKIETEKISETGSCLLDQYEKMLAGEYTSEVVRTHIPHLDEKLGSGGIAPGEVCVIAAPTSCGKSALALNIALRAAQNEATGCLIFSFEMPARQITKRLVQAISGANLRQIEERVIAPDKMEKVREAFKILEKLPIYTEHTVKSGQDLINKTKSVIAKHDVKLVVIDYLQLVPWNSKLSKNDGIAEVSHKVKQLALETNVAVLLLCQVNREGAKRESGIGLYDLKDSGDIENDADIAVLMYPEGGDIESCKKLDNHGPYTKLQYMIAKNREGERGVRGHFIFRHLSGRFY
jgi:replicative DNA helicase